MQSMKADHAAAFALSEEDKRRADAAMHGAKKTYAQGATAYMATQLSQGRCCAPQFCSWSS